MKHIYRKLPIIILGTYLFVLSALSGSFDQPHDRITDSEHTAAQRLTVARNTLMNPCAQPAHIKSAVATLATIANDDTRNTDTRTQLSALETLRRFTKYRTQFATTYAQAIATLKHFAQNQALDFELQVSALMPLFRDGKEGDFALNAIAQHLSNPALSLQHRLHLIDTIFDGYIHPSALNISSILMAMQCIANGQIPEDEDESMAFAGILRSLISLGNGTVKHAAIQRIDKLLQQTSMLLKCHIVLIQTLDDEGEVDLAAQHWNRLRTRNLSEEERQQVDAQHAQFEELFNNS